MKLSLLHHELEFAAEAWPDATAIKSPHTDVSYKQLNERATALAGALQSLGLAPGDRLAILGHNSADYITWHYAAAKAGVIFHVLNTRLARGELVWMVDNAESSVIIADSDFAARANDLVMVCPSLRLTIGMDGETGLAKNTEALAVAGHKLTSPAIDPDDAALMIYTSGTTGRPKGALQSHGGSLLADKLTRDAVEITGDDVYLALMPFFHQAGLIRTRATLLAGGIAVIPGKVEAGATADAIARHGVTFTMIASPQQNAAIREKMREDGPEVFSNLRMILGGGGSGERAAATIKTMCDALDCTYFGVYGQTETTGPAVYIKGDDVFERPASCGKPFPGIDIEIWNDAHEPQPPETTGEIVVRGAITARYWRNDEANAALYEGSIGSSFIHTGDLGYMDAGGFLYFKGRLKELVKTGAENVYPREVEAVLETHPGIADVAIIGLPDKDWGEVVCAAIVGRGDETPDLETLRAFCRDKIGGYKIPKRMIVVDAIPRNHTGKILRAPLVERAMKER